MVLKYQSRELCVYGFGGKNFVNTIYFYCDDGSHSSTNKKKWCNDLNCHFYYIYISKKRKFEKESEFPSPYNKEK